MNGIITPTKSQQLSPKNIPEELRKLDRWVVSHAKDDYRTPGGTRNNARNNDPDTWSSFKDVYKWCKKHPGCLPTFVFQKNDPWSFLDLDDCFKDGKLYPWAKELIKDVGKRAWWECSTSGEGLHCLVRGSFKLKKTKLEGESSLQVFSDTKRFCIITTRLHGPAEPNILDKSNEIKDLLSKHAKNNTLPPGNVSLNFSLWDGKTKIIPENKRKELVDKINQIAKSLYYKGSDSKFFENYDSASEAQYFLISELAESCQGDELKVDYLYMHSELSHAGTGNKRSESYRKHTIGKICFQWAANNREFNKDLNDWAYIHDPGVFVNRYNSIILKKSQFNDSLSKGVQGGKKAASFRFWNNPDTIKVQKLTFKPGWSETFGIENGMKAYNTWVENKVNSAPGCVKRWLKEVERVIPDKQVRWFFLNFVKACILNVKVSYMMIIQSAPGVGKDAILRPVIKAIGQHYCNDNVFSSDFSKDKQDWSWEKVLCVVQELNAFKQGDFNNLIKTRVTTPPEKVPMDLKHKGSFLVDNVCNYIAFTNFVNPMRAEKDDRRTLYYESPADPMTRFRKKKEMVDLWNYLESPELAAALQLWALESPDTLITHLTAKQANIGHKEQLHASSEDSLMQSIRLDWEERAGVFQQEVSLAREFLIWIKERYPEAQRRRLVIQRLISMFQNSGIDIRLYKIKDHNDNYKNLFIFRNYKFWYSLTHKQVFKKLEKMGGYG